MRHLMVIFLAFIFLTCICHGTLWAFELDNHQAKTKDSSHVGLNPGTPDHREGGETIADALVIPSLPFNDTGNTVNNINDYDSACPYSGSISRDVVYSFTPVEDLVINVDLCGSGYDTKTYIFDASLNVVACNDDAYSGPPCGLYVSLIEDAPVMAGNTYYIVIDGYGEDAGDYVLEVTEGTPPPPCIISCSGIAEGEPTLGDGYVDVYNSGCYDSNGAFPFQRIMAGDAYGNTVFCGKAGWYSPDGSLVYRDTDWFTVEFNSLGVIEWTLDAEQPTFGFQLSPLDCADVGVEQQMLAGPCQSNTMVIQDSGGYIVWLWVGSEQYEPPIGFLGSEFNYSCHFTGLGPGPMPTDKISFGGIKSLFR